MTSTESCNEGAIPQIIIEFLRMFVEGYLGATIFLNQPAVLATKLYFTEQDDDIPDLNCTIATTTCHFLLHDIGVTSQTFLKKRLNIAVLKF